MIDTGLAAVITAAVALLVGILVGVVAPFINRGTTLSEQRASARSTALLRVLHIVALNAQGSCDRVFNLTKARLEHAGNRDPVTGESLDLYAPQPRQARDLRYEELAEADALLIVYGSPAIGHAYKSWDDALKRTETLIVAAESWYFEGQRRAKTADFQAEVADELEARTQLGQLIRRELHLA